MITRILQERICLKIFLRSLFCNQINSIAVRQNNGITGAYIQLRAIDIFCVLYFGEVLSLCSYVMLIKYDSVTIPHAEEIFVNVIYGI